jgi:hypothetical protein
MKRFSRVAGMLRRPLMLRITFRVLLLVVASVSAALPQHPTVPPELVPDHIAFTALFYVIRDAPPPHWDRPTVARWLEARGFEGDAGEILVRSANRFYERHHDVESRLAQLNQATRNSLAPVVAAQRQVLQDEARNIAESAAAELRLVLPAPLKLRLAGVIADIKQNMKMRER